MPVTRVRRQSAQETATQKKAREQGLVGVFGSWYAVKQQVALLSKKLNDSKKDIYADLEALGTVDDAGHRYFTLPQVIGKVRTLKYQKAVRSSLDDEAAAELLRKKGLYDDAVDLLPVLNADKINALYFSKKISKADLDQMFPQNVTYSLVLLDDEGKQVS